MSLRSVVIALFCLTRLCSGSVQPNPCSSSNEYFPPKNANWSGTGLNWGTDYGQWLAEYLKFMKEPSLYACSSGNDEPQYRFIWDRSLTDQTAVRLVVHSDGTATLFARVVARDVVQPPTLPGHEPPAPQYRARLKLDKEIIVPADKVDHALALFKQIDFGNPRHNMGATDGSDWIFESKVDRQYRLADFRDEPSGAPRAFGLYLVQDLAEIRVPPNEIY